MKTPCLALLGLALLAGASSLAAQTPEETRRLARDIFRELIETNTTHSQGDTTVAAEAMARRLREAGFPAQDVRVLGQEPRSGNLVARLRGTGRKKPLLLLGHLDVVEARPEDWSVDPFTFLEKDGYFYGRGTSDIKDGDAILITTLLRLLKEGFRPDRDLIVALTAGEESGGHNGVEWLLLDHRDLIDAEFSINTDSGFEKKGERRWAALIETAEKRAVTFEIASTDPGGHSSVPRPANPIYRVAEALLKISRYTFPVALNETTRGYFARRSASETGPAAADMKAVAGDPPDEPAALRLSRDPELNALLRTTCVATEMNAGHAVNALPQSARASINCRIVPGGTVEEVRATLETLIGDPAVALATVALRQGATPGASPLRPDVSRAAEKVSSELWPGVVVLPHMMTGATDGFYLRNRGIPTYGVSGVFFDASDIRAHGRDERVGVEDFYQGVEFFYRFVKALASPE